MNQVRTNPKKTFFSEYCGGRLCPRCHKCNDWYVDSDAGVIGDSSSISYAHHVGPLVGKRHQWIRRLDATCGYRSYPHYTYYVAYHGPCMLARSRSYRLNHKSCKSFHAANEGACTAVHGPKLCHCYFRETRQKYENAQVESRNESSN